MATFSEKLTKASEKNQSLLCVGLDPDPSRMAIGDVFEFNKTIIDATKDLVCAYKPNVAFYDALGESGHVALRQTIDYIPPDIPIIGDSKRGDVQPTSSFHAKAMFEVWGFDAATVNPYGGSDAVQPFLDYRDKGIFVWCRSSNPGAREIQDLQVEATDGHGARPLYEWVAIRSMEWNHNNNVGLVVGATYPEQLRKVRELCPDAPMLVPGIGAQLGALEESVRYGIDKAGRNAIINVSRSIIYASEKSADFDKAARREAESLRDRINWGLESQGVGWDELAPSVSEVR